MPDSDGVVESSGSDDFDYEASAARIGAMLGVPDSPAAPDEPDEKPGIETAPPVSSASAPVTYDVPKSWKKEMHEHWGKVTPEAQAYIIEREKQLLDGFSTFRPIQDAITPYLDWLQRSNIRPEHAINSLLNAQLRLTQGPMESRRAAFEQLRKQLGFDEPTPTNGQNGSSVAPELQAVQQELSSIKQDIEAQRQQAIQAIYNENVKKLDAFAADTAAHPYFEEVADEMAIFLRQGMSLPDAYAKAVRVNEAVWAKEQARLLTEAEAKWKENARLASLPKKKAASVNIKSDKDGQEPTEPLGSIEDTIKREHAKILARS